MTFMGRSHRGFGLIEVLIMIIVLGILAAVAMRSMTALVSDSRKVETGREMDKLAKAIAGDPSVTNAGIRSDFGYVGDIGAFPPDLRALRTNPSGYATWKGPYVTQDIAQDSVSFRLDGWGVPYVYTGGTTITSTGSGSAITRKFANAISDYLSNVLSGTVVDVNGSPPGPVLKDSVRIVMTVPNGAGGTAIVAVSPDSNGAFQFNSLPVGSHPIEVIFTPVADTLHRFATVLPRNRGAVGYKFAFAHFDASPADSRRCELIIQASRVVSDLSDFPVLLTEANLPIEMFDAGGQYPAANGGDDIWFSSDISGNNRLPSDIQNFTISPNPALGKAEIWVGVPSVSATSNMSIYVWYHNPGQTQPAPNEPYGANEVWDNNYVVVQHLNEDPASAPPQCIDATRNGNNGSVHGAMNSGDRVDGQVGNSLEFDGVNDYISIPAGGVTVAGSSITMEAWIYVIEASGRANVLQRGSNYALFEFRNGGFPYSTFYSGGWQEFNFGKNVNWFRTDWHYVTCTYDGSQVRTFIDGAPDRDYAYSATLDPYTNNYDLGIALNVGWNDSYFRGRIDEVRISNSARSAGWIAAQYNNQNDPATFVIPGTPESP